jgi:hypothetical protein
MQFCWLSLSQKYTIMQGCLQFPEPFYKKKPKISFKKINLNFVGNLRGYYGNIGTISENSNSSPSDFEDQIFHFFPFK